MKDFESQLNLAREEMRSGSHEKALNILLRLKAEVLALDDSDFDKPGERTRVLVKIFNNLGVTQKNAGSLDEAASSLEEALQVAARLDVEGIRARAGILSNLGLLYSRRKQYSKGLATFNQALDLASSHPGEIPTNLTVKLHNNRALFFVRFGEPEKAREELAMALEAAHDDVVNGNAQEREAWLTANLAMVHAELACEEVYNPSLQDELYRQARTMFVRSSEIYESIGYSHHRLKQLLNASEVNIRLKAYEDAKRQLIGIALEAERIKDGRLICEVAHTRLELSIETQDHKQITSRIIETAALLREVNPPDLKTRLSRLEGLLRKSGRADAIRLLEKSDKPKPGILTKENSNL